MRCLEVQLIVDDKELESYLDNVNPLLFNRRILRAFAREFPYAPTSHLHVLATKVRIVDTGEPS